MALENRMCTGIKFDRENPTATETYTCPWEEAAIYANALTGGWQTALGIPGYNSPASFIEVPGLKCTGVDVSPLDKDARTAILTVSYGKLNHNPDSGDPLDIAEITTSHTSEAIACNSESLGNTTWTSGTNTGKKVNKNIPPRNKWFPSMEISIKFQFKPNNPIDTWGDIIGKANSASVTLLGKSFGIETLLCTGVNTGITYTTDGTKGHSREIKLVYRKTGWQKVYDPETNQFNTVSHDLYEKTSFTPLWAD